MAMVCKPLVAMALMLIIVSIASTIFSLYTALAERLPTMHGLLGPYLYFRVDAPNETLVNTSTNIFLTIAALEDIHVNYIVAAVYGCGVNVSGILINNTVLGVNRSLSYVFSVTPRAEGFLRITIAALYNYYNPSTGSYIAQYTHIAFNVTVVRVLTYRSLLEKYKSLEEELNALRDSYRKLLDNFSNLTTTYITIAREGEQLYRDYRNLTTMYTNAVERLNRLEQFLLNLNTSYTTTSKSLSDMEKRLEELSLLYNALRRGYEVINMTLTSTLNSIASHQKDIVLSLSTINESVLNLEKMYRDVADNQRNLTTSFTDLQQSYRDLEQRYTELSNAYTKALQHIDTLSQDISTIRTLALILTIVVSILITLLTIALLRKRL
jgi:archaellum component FlaC